MTPKKPRSFRRKAFRIFVVTLVVLALAVAGLHLWFVNNARNVLRQIVAEKSHGKLKLELSSLSFNFFSNKIQIREADLVSTDTVSQPSTYRVQFRKLTLRVHSFWPLLTQKKLLLDSIKLHDPDIEVSQWRKDTSGAKAKKEVSIPEQMGDIYNSMLEAFDAFGIRHIEINNARFTLLNKMLPNAPPVVLSKIFLHIERTGREEDKGKYLGDKQTVEMRTSDQNFFLPSGRHKITFKSFKLQLFRRRVEMDSCTITALPTETSKNEFRIFFKKLMLVGMDFNAMYRDNLIKADSVYCEEPLVNIHLNANDAYAAKAGEKTRSKPDPSAIVRELTGDLELGFVGLKNAGVHIDISRGDKQRSLVNSNRDNFEMRGLRINADSAMPVTVERFDMLVRNYRLYNADSSGVYSFDSMHFLNNKIVLNNFTVSTENSFAKQRDQRDFRIPYFELQGLDWNALVFEGNVEAEAAYLLRPVINYKKNGVAVKTKKKTDLFVALQSLDSMLTLKRVNIVDGQFNVTLNNSTSMQLRDVNLGLQSGDLMNFTSSEGLRRAVKVLSVSRGKVKLKDLSIDFQNIGFKGSSLLHADRILLNNTAGKMKAEMNDVYLNNLLLDENSETIVADGFRWKNANVVLRLPEGKPSGEKKSGGPAINLKNLSGGPTRFQYAKGPATITTLLNSINLASLTLKEGKITTEGLAVAGNDFAMTDPVKKISAASYRITHNGPSFLTGVEIGTAKPGDTLSVTTPRIDFNADINSLLDKQGHLSSVTVTRPVIRLMKWKGDSAAAPEPKAVAGSTLLIDRITLDEPTVNIVTHLRDSVTVLAVPSSARSRIGATGFRMDGDSITAATVSFHTTAATLTSTTGSVMGVEKGKVDIEAANFELSKRNGKPYWSAAIRELSVENPNTFRLGKGRNSLIVGGATIGNLNLSSDYFGNLNKLAHFNLTAWIRTTNGTYTDSNTVMAWHNAHYDVGQKTFRLDSFRYNPARPRDSVIARSPFQTDYITFRSGAIELTGFDLEKYEKDSAILASTMTIDEPEITIFRDKLPPFNGGTIKPLPVGLLRRIPYPVSVERINLRNGKLFYTERNAKTRVEGTLLLSQMNAMLGGLHNHTPKEKDSLTIIMNAMLMDSARLDLRVRQSYADTLGAFLMTLRMKPTSLSFLNPVLAPLSNIKIKSGVIDSLHLRAVGREYIAFGEMNMFYHDLRIQLVKDGDPDKSTVFGNVVSFLANRFVIRRNNNGRTGVVYFERLRDRSFFNYIVKIAFAGMTTSTGVKKNGKMIKKYRKLLKEQNLPEIQYN